MLEQHERDGVEVYRYTDKTFSMVDAISFVVMERLEIAVVLGFDSDFTQYGFMLAED